MNYAKYKNDIESNGFAIMNGIYTQDQIRSMIAIINSANQDHFVFRKTKDLFAIRNFLQAIPSIHKVLWNENVHQLINTLFGKDYFVIKSIYFDKPGESNWFVPFHQDLTISVNEKTDIPGYTAWTSKQGQIAVQPPESIHKNIYTLRIHLDDCDEQNGALRVIPGSHKNGVQRARAIPLENTAAICDVKKGGVMIMKPLLMHASSRSTSNQQRRVIHIEFANVRLPQNLQWREYYSLVTDR
jgi:ectoine hydroxylase-related dioxygenase (phytanoyl-CoA dioxygenase family)